MKKNIKYLFLMAILFLFGFANVKAAEIDSADIKNNTYVIGTHMFTEDTMLFTSHIMLASKTIDSNNLNDMIIYYKKPRTGEWINGATGERIEVPTKFQIDYIDLSWNVETPVFFNTNKGQEPEYVNYENGIYKYSLWFNNEDYSYLNSETGLYVSDVEGFEFYEKVGENYTLIKTSEYDPNKGSMQLVEVEAGTQKTFVMRVYTLDSNDNKVYSDYSNEIVIDHTTN